MTTVFRCCNEHGIVIDRVPKLGAAAAHQKERMKNAILDHMQHAFEHGADRSEITAWTWPH